MAEQNITAKFKLDISELKKGITDANNQIKMANSQFKAATAGMDDWTKSSEGIAAKLKQLKTVLDEQNKKLQIYQQQLAVAKKAEQEAGTAVANLKNQLEAAKKTYGENSSEVKKLQTQLVAADKEYASTKKQVADLTVTMNNQKGVVAATEKDMRNFDAQLKNVSAAEKEAAKNGTTVEQELKKMSASAEEASESTGKLGDKLGGALANGAKVAVSALAAAGAAVVGLGIAAIKEYANYEQLVGGVETLFGAGGQSLEEYAKSVGKSVADAQGEYNKMMSAQDTVMKNAAEAYKTAGMSANQYMEQATATSAALVQSLGGDTEKAAKLTNQAIIDMSDNANKMGTDIGRITDAYGGFAKQNFTMLDNLKLGYGGTKTEMERLLKDAEKISGIKYDISSYADITEAIHVIQNEMGITGTTAKEAATTIQGSVNSMKGAWSNLMIGLTDDTQDFDQLLSNFVESLGTVVANLLPRVKTVMSGVIQLVQGLLPQLVSLIQEILPVIVEGASNLLKGVIDALPGIVQAFIDIVPQITQALLNALPQLVTVGVQLITSILTGLGTMIPQIINQIIEIVPKIVQALVDAIPQLLQGAIKFFMAIIQAIPTIVQNLTKAWPQIVNTVIKGLTTAIPLVLQGAIKLLMAIVNAIPQIIPPLVDSIPTIINTLINGLIGALPQVLDGAVQLLMAIVQAIPIIINALVPQIPRIVSSIVTTLIANTPTLIKGAVQLMMGIVTAIPQIALEVAKAAPQIIAGLVKGLLSAVGQIGNVIKTIGSTIVGGIKSFFGIHSPSTVAAGLGKYITIGLGEGMASQTNKVVKQTNEIGKKVMGGFAKANKSGEYEEFGKNSITGLINGITSKKKSLSSAAKDTAQTFVKTLKKELKISSPSRLLADSVGQFIPAGIAEGIEDNLGSLKRSLNGMAQETVALSQQMLGSVRVPALATESTGVTNNYTQIINAPKQPTRDVLYRQTQNLLNLKGVK